MKIYVDWENEFILTEKEYREEMEKQQNLTTMDWVGFEEWVANNFSTLELLNLMYEGSNGFDKLRAQWASFMMKETYCEVDLADD